MLDTSQDFDECQKELGLPVEQLFTPLTRYTPQRPKERFAVDNGAFSSFQEKAFLALLEREKPRVSLCRFVAVPDIVGNALRTLEVFKTWHKKLSGWPLALVAQDGQQRYPIPWDSIQAVFIGGTTGWKMSRFAVEVIKTGKALGKWVHAGRVNTPGRLEYFRDLGVDSIDGTGLSRYTHMREAVYRRSLRKGLIYP